MSIKIKTIFFKRTERAWIMEGYPGMPVFDYDIDGTYYYVKVLIT
jgi:hypothetical protein